MFQNVNVEGYFNKSFEFLGNENWVLPERAYSTPAWSIDRLQTMKLELNAVKGQLNQFPLTDWSKHTKRTDPSSLVKHTIGTRIKIELLTQAWCKFYECLNSHQVIPEVCVKTRTLNSLHLCEAPGAFISALNYYLYVKHKKIKWNWSASTLNPFYEGNSLSEMISDYSLIQQTIANWNFGHDQTGDLRYFQNYQVLVELYSNRDLVTADGSVDCMSDPGEQEGNVHHLHFCEVMTALRVLRKGGNFVLKLFTMYEHGTICLMYLLNCCFNKVTIFKPCSSKWGNSEVYVICRLYKGFDLLRHLWDSLLLLYTTGTKEAMFDLSVINTDFMMQLEECARYFKELQCARINENIQLFYEDNPEIWSYIENVQRIVANVYVKKCHVFNIPKERRLLKRGNKKRQVLHHASDFKVTNVYSQLDDDNLIKITTGRAFDQVQSSCFGCASVKLSCNDLPEGLPQPAVIIDSSCFESGISQYTLHRRFFQVILERSRTCSDMVLSGVPLLTRFLVGVVYILSLGFESFVVCNAGVIVFHDYNEFKFYIMRKHFERIAAAYDRLQSGDFLEDVLEVVPFSVLSKGNFYKAICKYNSEICT